MNIDKNGANAAAIVSYHAGHGTTILIRKNQYLNHRIEQDHRGVQRLTCSMLGFKSFDAAQAMFTGIELIRMLRKGQRENEEMEGLTVAEPFYQLGASSPHRLGTARPCSTIHPDLRQ